MALAGGVVGTGTACSCTDAALNTGLTGGGLVTFNCGGPWLIDISPGAGGTSTKTISADTTIDGAGGITISGGNSVGVFSVDAGVKFTVQNLIIADGHSAADGGGIFNRFGGTLTITNSTFSGNYAALVFSGGAIFSGGTLTVTNTVLANSTVGGNCGGTITDGGHNIDDGTTCGFTSASGSLSSTNPQLDPAGLRNNAGPTQTVALCTGAGMPVGCTAASPAINAGDESVCSAPPVNNLDQRGFVRPGTGHTQCSIGAYEAAVVAVCTGDCSGTFTVAINDLITLVNIALSTAQPSACTHGIPDGAVVDIALIIQAVNHALNGCGGG